MKASTHDKLAGTRKSVAGAFKQGAGKLLGNRELQAKGDAEQVEGKLQRKLGAIEKKAGK